MEPTADLVKQLRREAIENARRQTVEQKFRAGFELFDYACEITKAGIRLQHPQFTEEQVLDELRRRPEIRTRREERARQPMPGSGLRSRWCDQHGMRELFEKLLCEAESDEV